MTKEDQERIEGDGEKHQNQVMGFTHISKPKECYISGATHERSLMEKEKWISVKDKLPELDVNVLCYSLGDYVEGYYCSVDKVFKPEIERIGYMENDIMKIDVTHWQPLPEPPTETLIK